MVQICRQCFNLFWQTYGVSFCVRNLSWANWKVQRSQWSRVKLEPELSMKYHTIIQEINFLETSIMVHSTYLCYEFWSSVTPVSALFSYKVAVSPDVSSVCIFPHLYSQSYYSSPRKPPLRRQTNTERMLFIFKYFL